MRVRMLQTIDRVEDGRAVRYAKGERWNLSLEQADEFVNAEVAELDDPDPETPADAPAEPTVPAPASEVSGTDAVDIEGGDYEMEG